MITTYNKDCNEGLKDIPDSKDYLYNEKIKK